MSEFERHGVEINFGLKDEKKTLKVPALFFNPSERDDQKSDGIVRDVVRHTEYCKKFRIHYLGADLVAALAGLQVHDFSHFVGVGRVCGELIYTRCDERETVRYDF